MRPVKESEKKKKKKKIVEARLLLNLITATSLVKAPVRQ